jgi:hypothetical protein
MNSSLTGRKLLYFLLFLYEISRTIFILIARPESVINILPFSWYIAVPLLFIPFLLLYHMYENTENACFCSHLFILVKLSALISYVFFIYKDLPFAIQNLKFRNPYSIRNILHISIFFIIDVIIIIVFSIYEHNNPKNREDINKNNSKEGIECK